jgi:hypothetical protein
MTLNATGKMGLLVLAAAALTAGAAEVKKRGDTSYMPVDQKEPFASVFKRMTADKPKVERRHREMLESRYDLSNRPAKGATMFRGKPLQEGVRAKLREGVTWQSLAAMSPDQMRERDVFPSAFKPLPHPNHPKAAWSFPSSTSTRSSGRKGAT